MKAGGLLAAAFLAGPGVARLLTSGLADLEDVIQLRRLVRDHRTARRLGRQYLAAWPEEAARSLLVAALLDRTTRADAREQVTQRMRADYEAGRTVTLDGWVVSRSEGRLFALHALG